MFRKIEDGLWRVTNFVDLHYSPDDNGYYFQDYEVELVSEAIYPTFADAIQAFENNEIEWVD